MNQPAAAQAATPPPEAELGKIQAGTVILRLAGSWTIESQLPAVERVDRARPIDDVRVALIKLAERTCAIRAVKNADDDKRHRVAREVFDIYAPLAHRLGIGHIKWELEDLGLRYLEPESYQRIAKLLAGRRQEREDETKEGNDGAGSAQ